MTSLVSWVGVDTHGPASAYIATDSRIAWGNGATWDFGRKTFASARLPFIFGYVGVVLFPTLVLSQFIDALDTGVVDPMGFDEMRTHLMRTLVTTHESLRHADERGHFEIIACSRDGEGTSARFRIGSIVWSGSGWSTDDHPLPSTSGVVVNRGSGASAVAASLVHAQGTPSEGTSRAVFTAFAKAIRDGLDPKSGGPPQLAGIYRKWPGATFGVVSHGERTLHGLPIRGNMADTDLQWRNELFERCDGRGRRLQDAQRH